MTFSVSIGGSSPSSPPNHDHAEALKALFDSVKDACAKAREAGLNVGGYGGYPDEAGVFQSVTF